jgi:hypothetical protein
MEAQVDQAAVMEAQVDQVDQAADQVDQAADQVDQAPPLASQMDQATRSTVFTYSRANKLATPRFSNHLTLSSS